MSDERIPCEICGARALPATIERNAGLCKPCANRVRAIAEAARDGRLDHALARLNAAPDRLWNDPSSRASVMARVDSALEGHVAPDYPRCNFDGSVLLWTIHPRYPERLVAVYDRAVSPDRYAFIRGKAVPEGGGTPVFRVDGARRDLAGRDVVENDARLPLVGPALGRALVDAAGPHVQMLDTVVRFADGDATDYLAVNVASTVSLIDHSLSRYRLIGEGSAILGIERLVCRESRFADTPIAREAEYPGLIYVSGELGCELRAAGFGDVWLSTPAAYFDYVHLATEPRG